MRDTHTYLWRQHAIQMTRWRVISSRSVARVGGLVTFSVANIEIEEFRLVAILSLMLKCMAVPPCTQTRNNSMKLKCRQVNSDCTKFFFTNIVVREWNKLPPSVVQCNTIDSFKTSSTITPLNLMYQAEQPCTLTLSGNRYRAKLLYLSLQRWKSRFRRLGHGAGGSAFPTDHLYSKSKSRKEEELNFKGNRYDCD